MSKKLITACLGVLALAAFALPAVASASPVITHPTGTVLGTGKTITGTNIGNAILTTDPTSGSPSPLSECTTVKVTGTLVKNSGTAIEGNITTATFSGSGSAYTGMNECLGFFGLGNLTPTTNGTDPVNTKMEPGSNEDVAGGTPWCLRSAANDKVELTGGTCGTEPVPVTFILHSTGAGECKFSKSSAVEGTFTTDSTGDAIVNFVGGAGTTFVKEAGGVLCPSAGTLDMSFTMETDTAATEPIYIS